MDTNGGASDPGPDIRMSDVGIRDQLQQVHLDSIVEHDADRAGLPPAPADAVNLRIVVVESPGPFLAKRIIPVGPNSLVQAKGSGGNADEVQCRERDPRSYEADPSPRLLVDLPLIPEGLRQRSDH